MALRGIEKITLYKAGFVVCRDNLSRQAISMQGMFPDVVDNIANMFGKSDVRWVIIPENEEVTVTFEEWIAYGRSLGEKVIETKPADITELKIDGYPKAHPEDQE